MGSISEFIESPALLRYASVLVPLILFGLFWWRSGSAFSLWERVWRVVSGSKETHDKKIDLFIHENHCVEKFGFIYGIKTENLEELYRLVDWLKKYSIGIASASKARRWIKMETADIIFVPRIRYVLSLGVVFLGAIALCLCSVMLTQYPAALLKTNRTDVWFSLDAKSAHSPFFDRWSFDAAACQNDIDNIMIRSKFDHAEVESVCRLLTASKPDPFLEKALREQRWSFAGLAAIFAVIVAKLMTLMAAAGAADQIRRKIKAHNSSLASPNTKAVAPPKPRRRRNSSLSATPAAAPPVDAIETPAPPLPTEASPV